jgi:hypothetical protein
MNSLALRGEDDAWALLGRALDDATPDLDLSSLTLADWPELRALITPGDGSIPTELGAAMKALQLSFWRSFAVLVHGRPSVSLLTLAEKKALEVPQWVEPGSTRWIAKLSRPLLFLISRLTDGMSSKEKAVVLCLLGLAASSAVCTKIYFDHSANRHHRELVAAGQRELLTTFLQLSREETERTKLLHLALERSERGRQVLEASVDWRPALMSSVPLVGKMTLQGVEFDGRFARNIGKQPVAFRDWVTTVTRHSGA